MGVFFRECVFALARQLLVAPYARACVRSDIGEHAQRQTAKLQTRLLFLYFFKSPDGRCSLVLLISSHHLLLL